MESLTRRDFIRVGAAASASAALAGSAGALAASPRRKRVVIVGGGLAGLAAAHELLKRKVSAEIVILEAQGRVGGRVLTVRSHMNQGTNGVPFADGQYLEAGAHRIPETHDRTLAYASELGLGGKIIEFSKALGRGEKGATQYLINDERFLFDAAAGWPAALGLTPTERTTPFFPQDIEYEYRWVTGPKPPKGTNHLGNPAIPFCGPANWPYGDGNRAALDEWNGYTVAQFLASRGASSGWQRLYAAENGTEVFSTTALAWVIQSALDWDWGTTYYLDGGLDQIPRTLANSVVGRGAALQLNSPVRRIDQTSTGASVTYRDAGGTIRTLAADRVVLTPTFTVLREKVELSGAALPADKQHWIDTLQMMPVTRISLQVNHRFWADEGVEGLKIAGTDTPIERIWHSTNLQPGQSGIMQAYLQHQNALTATAPADKLTWMRDQVAPRLFPQITSAWNGLGMAKLWHQDEWERGGWVSPKAHEFLAGFHVWGRQEGRIHFAGDSTSLMAGWMQGGIESGQRAACEVATAL